MQVIQICDRCKAKPVQAGQSAINRRCTGLLAPHAGLGADILSRTNLSAPDRFTSMVNTCSLGMLQFVFSRRLLLVFLAAVIATTSACPSREDYIALHRAWSTNDAEQTDLQKRWYSVAGPGYLFWPNGRIRYCFDQGVTASQQQQLEALLRNAWDSWINAGVDANVLSFQQGDDDLCQNHPLEALHVMLHPDGACATTLGRGEPGQQPIMDLNIDILTPPSQANDDLLGIVTHEIGHSLGLLHEHQRPDLWSKPPYAYATGSRNFFNFYCEDLPDYNEIAHLDRNRIHRLCTDALAALLHEPEFSSYDWLPVGGIGLDWEIHPPTGTDFDLQSVMIYPSRGLLSDWNVQGLGPILTLVNGDPIPENVVPSARDAARVNTMYRAFRSPAYNLLWQTGNPWAPAFQAMIQSLGECKFIAPPPPPLPALA